MARMTPLFSLCLFLVAATTTTRAVGRTLYAPKAIPAVWVNLGPAPDNTSLTFDLILRPRNDSGLQQRMLEVARSRSKWLTEDEIASYIAPSPDVKATVGLAIRELEADNLTWTRNGDTLRVRTTVGKAAKFFGTRFSTYSHTQTGESVYKANNYTFPTSMEPHIHDIPSFVTFSNFTRSSGVVNPVQEKRTELYRSPACNASSVTSACIRALYQLDSYTPTTSDGTPRLGILGYSGENFNQADLKQYLEIYRPEASSYVVPVTNINGATNNGHDPTPEAQIDTQVAAGIIYPLPSRYYDLAGDGDLALLTFQYFLGLPVSERPSVISVSYNDVELSATQTQASSMCTAAQQLTAAGMTIVFSTGDQGVSPDNTCPPFRPTYPSGCPYILAVGGTQDFSPESAVAFSGAGFSNFFETPSFQSSAVEAYERELDITNSGYFNKTGRAFPDISAQAAPQPIIVAAKLALFRGTSLAAPIVASAITLLNDLLIKAGKPTVGWAQPYFYACPDAFTDITEGGSYGCGSTNYGLPAKPGWDASSGLGTLLFPKLRAIYGV